MTIIMTAIVEGNYLGDVLKYEAPNLYSREEVKIAKRKKKKSNV